MMRWVRVTNSIDRCGLERRPALSVHTMGGVRAAVVSLVGPKSAVRGAGVTAEVEVRDCRMSPPVAVLSAAGGTLAVVNGDERRSEVVLEHLGEYGAGVAEQIARLPLPLVGQRYELSIGKPGIVRATFGKDKRDGSYLVVAAHAFTQVTGVAGTARLEGVPAGTHEIVVWHRPPGPGKKPLIARGSVTVRAGETATQTISLAP